MKPFLLALIFLAVPLAYAQDEWRFELSSPAFKASEEIPALYSCQGTDINPPLTLAHIPAKTKSLAITMHSPDAPEGLWVHWVLYNIKPDTAALEANTKLGTAAFNDFGKYAYNGPCPTDDKQHYYVFRAYALDVILPNNESWTMKDVEKAMAGHIIAKSQLIALYRKPVW